MSPIHNCYLQAVKAVMEQGAADPQLTVALDSQEDRHARIAMRFADADLLLASAHYPDKVDPISIAE